MCCGRCRHVSGLKTVSMVSNLETHLVSLRCTVCGPVMLAPVCHTVSDSWVVFWNGSLSLTRMVIGVTISQTADSPLLQVSVDTPQPLERYCICWVHNCGCCKSNHATVRLARHLDVHMEWLSCLMQGNVAPLQCRGTAGNVAMSQFGVAWVCIQHWKHAGGCRASVLHIVFVCAAAMGGIVRGAVVATIAP